MSNLQTIMLIVAIVAIALTVGSAAGKVPLWSAVFVICIGLLLLVFPIK